MRSFLLVVATWVVSSVRGADVFTAIGSDNVEQMKVHLRADPASLDRTGPGGQSPLMHAVLTGKERAVKHLLEAGADVTVGEKDGYTPMHGAGFQGRAAIVESLVSAGVPLDEVHADGHPPVTRACWGREKRHAETVAKMVELGATLKSPKDCPTNNIHTKSFLANHFKDHADL